MVELLLTGLHKHKDPGNKDCQLENGANFGAGKIADGTQIFAGQPRCGGENVRVFLNGNSENPRNGSGPRMAVAHWQPILNDGPPI